MKAVFDTRPGSGYLDTISTYQFPSRYLRHVNAALGDWVVYYEPSREDGRKAYVATARVDEIEVDASRPGHHRAMMKDYLPFDAPVALRGPEGYRERRLRDLLEPSAVGRTLQGRAVRELTDEDFGAIVQAGLSRTLATNSIAKLKLAQNSGSTSDVISIPPDARILERMLFSRTIRDASFRRSVLEAYDGTCAVTGLKIVDGRGLPEAQAAHIVPVVEGGPDVVQNGIALSATVHWLFDRHLIALSEDWRLILRREQIPTALLTLLLSSASSIRLPSDRKAWPHSAFVSRHRERFFQSSN